QGETSVYVAILDAAGEMALAINAMPAMDSLVPGHLAAYEWRLTAARLLIADCNLPQQCLAWLARFADKLIIDTVSVAKVEKIRALQGGGVFAITCNRRQAEQACGVKITAVSDAFDAAAALGDQGF